MTENITVTKPHLPSRQNLQRYLDRVIDSRWLTNDGSLVRELTVKLEDYIGVENLLLVGNGTLGLMVALKVIGAEKIYTTPFSFPATTSAALWSGVDVCFGDVSPSTFNLTPPSDSFDSNGILATHVFGNPCDVDNMSEVSSNLGVPLIYDAAHAFAVRVNGRSVLDYGRISVLSFHATKLFHCVEGGAIKFASADDLALAREMINFGYDKLGEIQSIGINAKMNELEAAMGLAVLDEIDVVLDAYKTRYEMYDELLDVELQRQEIHDSIEYNYSYFPICFRDSNIVDMVIEKLNERNVFPRKYFSPSLDSVDAYNTNSICPVSRDIAARILCLPMYSDLPDASIKDICKVINETVDSSQ